MSKRLVIIQAAGLGYDFLRYGIGSEWQGLKFQALQSVFPALTCTAQASFRTATSPARHGMIANGIYLRELRKPLLWEQSSALVAGPRIWNAFRSRGKRVALLFWQQSLGEDVDMILSPAPIHKHGGGMIPSVYSKPRGLYESLCRQIGKKFQLHHYWGPLASPTSSDWIAQATALLLSDPAAPDLCLTYLPALDYDLQRYGPHHPASAKALDSLLRQITLIRNAAGRNGYDVVVFGDYAIGAAWQAIFPNRTLLDAGLFQTRPVAGLSYPDFHASTAFAMVDHEIAHVYLKAGLRDINAVRSSLAELEGVDQILNPAGQRAAGLAHSNSGDLVLVAKPGYWFAYPWWTSTKEAPDFASHVDIHNKPGYDPCELFFGWPPLSVSQDTTRIQGSHGRGGPDRSTAWAATCQLPETPATLQDLARIVQAHLETVP